MARVVMGIGTAHSPVCSEDPRYWAEHGQADLENPMLPDIRPLYSPPPSNIEDELAPERFEEKYDRVQQAIEETSKAIASAQPDVLVVVGDDQDDLFMHEEAMPPLAIYCGDTFVNRPKDESKYPQWYRSSLWGHYPIDKPEEYPAHPELARHLVDSLNQTGFDPATAWTEPDGRHVGHAFTFLNRRLVPEPWIPMVPVMLNTYFPPNQPQNSRCYELGLALAEALGQWESDSRVALVASGGLTHPVLDENLDREVIRALEMADHESLVSMREELFTLGTSEIKNWITVSAAMTALDMSFELVDYIPAYRSKESTGCGLTFARWS